jgi:hypothetical protein
MADFGGSTNTLKPLKPLHLKVKLKGKDIPVTGHGGP